MPVIVPQAKLSAIGWLTKSWQSDAALIANQKASEAVQITGDSVAGFWLLG
jgi:hypothetical protein